jgi:hypothetical protein
MPSYLKQKARTARINCTSKMTKNRLESPKLSISTNCNTSGALALYGEIFKMHKRAEENP